MKYPCKTKEVSTEDLASEDKYSREIQEALTILTSYEKSVLLLKSVKGLSYKEIANILNKREPALRKQFERARKKVEKKLIKKKEEYDNEEISVF
ncbi:RNA polymerase sigma factor [Dethiothermospora halolimnae]|uniref:RNA polymerase sigma factor n=1 Tax=Dethiothermospora halolimnae TaxID=3114390 RepID=UPI003CCBE1AD